MHTIIWLGANHLQMTGLFRVSVIFFYFDKLGLFGNWLGMCLGVGVQKNLAGNGKSWLSQDDLPKMVEKFRVWEILELEWFQALQEDVCLSDCM